MGRLVPAIQTLIVIVMFVLGKVCHDQRLLLAYVLPLQAITEKLNFPLAAIWFPILYAVDNVISWPTKGVAFVIAVIVTGAVLLTSVAAFWYVVVREIEARSAGTPFLTFRNRFAEALKVFLFCAIGVTSVTFAYKDTASLLRFGRSALDLILGGIFLVVWAAILIGLSFRDFAVLLRRTEYRVRD